MTFGFISDNTRKIRKGLLISCLIGFAISKIGLTVTKVSLLGSEFAITRFETLPFVLGIVVLYFLITFVSYSFDEYSHTLRQLREEYIEKMNTGKVFSRREILQALEIINKDIIELELQSPTISSFEQRERINERLEGKMLEKRKLERIREFYEYYKGSFFERFRFHFFRVSMEIFAPIVIGIYTLLLLFFFTDIPQIVQTPSAKQTSSAIEGIYMKNNSNTLPANKDMLNNKNK